jgi:hypothetical protein
MATDAAAGTASLRTLGAGATQAAAGNHSHDAAAVVSGVFNIARLVSGTPDGTKFMADDSTLKSITRALLAADAKGWTPLGFTQLASPAIRTATITWTGTWQELEFVYFVAGYSGAAIARLIVGPTAGLSETGTTFCSTIIENVTLNQTSVSVPGWPLGVTAEAVERQGVLRVQNVAAKVKRMTGHGNSAGTAATTPPKALTFNGLFSDATNLINKAELAVYAALTGAAISSTTLNALTWLLVRGRNFD